MRTHRFAAFAVIVLALFVLPAFADGNFVKIGNIKGTATEAQHQGWIDAGLWGIATQDRSFSIWTFKYEPPRKLFWFEKKTDASSPALQKAMADKIFFDQAIFDMALRSQTSRTTFFAVRIHSVETHGGTEKVTLEFKTQKDQDYLPQP
jgi:type VI protein secretion system component Hcp